MASAVVLKKKKQWRLAFFARYLILILKLEVVVMLFEYFLDRQELFINHEKFNLFKSKKCIFRKELTHVDEKYVLKEIWKFWPKSWINPLRKKHFLVLKRSNFFNS